MLYYLVVSSKDQQRAAHPRCNSPFSGSWIATSRVSNTLNVSAEEAKLLRVGHHLSSTIEDYDLSMRTNCFVFAFLACATQACDGGSW
jgi:hypothetical protein